MHARLTGKKVLLGVTGGIAAYKACDLLRRLQDAGASVRVAMTPAAETFVQPLTFAALSGYPVYRQGSHAENSFQHIEYPRWADLMLVAPCSAHSLARLAQGMADEPVSLSWMASMAPKVIVPAMNSSMYASASVKRNLEILRGDGCAIVEPECGRLACGEYGSGRFPEIAAIIQAVERALGVGETRGRVLITAGRTEEPIDPVRVITNRSSGMTGVAIAQTFRDSGYHVTLIHGPMESFIPDGIETVPVRTALEMHAAVMGRQDQSDILIFCAAVADYRPAHPAAQKIKDSRSHSHLELTPNPSILRDAALRRKDGQILVGFALETENAVENGLHKLKRSGADILVLNTPVRPDSGFGKSSVEYCILHGGHDLQNAPQPVLGSKIQLARQLLQSVESLRERSNGHGPCVD